MFNDLFNDWSCCLSCLTSLYSGHNHQCSLLKDKSIFIIMWPRTWTAIFVFSYVLSLVHRSLHFCTVWIIALYYGKESPLFSRDWINLCSLKCKYKLWCFVFSYLILIGIWSKKVFSSGFSPKLWVGGGQNVHHLIFVFSEVFLQNVESNSSDYTKFCKKKSTYKITSYEWISYLQKLRNCSLHFVEKLHWKESPLCILCTHWIEPISALKLTVQGLFMEIFSQMYKV